MDDNASNSICPICIRSGVVSQLTKISTPNGRVENLCTSKKCNYPFSEYESCRLSVIQDKNDWDAKSMEDFWQYLLADTEGVDTGSLSTSQECHISPQSIQKSMLDIPHDSIQTNCGSPTENVSNNCMLPRYLADEMQRIATSTCKNASSTFRSSESKHHISNTNSLKRSARQILARSSCDSGISISTASLSSRMGYEEQQLTSQGDAKCSSSSTCHSQSTVNHSSSAQGPACNRRVVNQVETLVRLQQQRLRKA